jgi:steroid 5-alpha reductase family enzyme
LGFWQIYALGGLAILGLVSAVWLLSLLRRDSGIIDIFWGLGFILACWIYFAATPEGYPLRKWLLSLLVTVWGLRLSIHILLRNWGKSEDYRYAAWRQAAGKSWWWRSYFKVFLLQGFLLWLVSAPLLAAQVSASPARLTALDVLAVLVWGMGFFFEAAGDWQLRRFKANPANGGGLLTSGVWRYTRHPNYFGDAVQWWGFYLFALAAGGWWAVFSPLLMTFLLVRVSGVAMLEKSLVDNKPGYREYMRRTSAFIPWVPKGKK